MTRNAIKSNDGLPFSRRLREARAASGLTIAAVARELDVDPRTVAGWQADPPRSQPSYERLTQLARVLNVAPSFFLDEDAA